jgi:hypothetical protein
MQVPDWQVSPVVQEFASVHGAPFGLAGFEHAPFAGLQVPALWHWSLAVQVTGVPGWQVPDWQVSACVQALPSLHAVLFGLAGLEQVPLAGLQVPALWH